MASWRACDLRTLVAVVCGLLTTVVLGLGIWRAVVRIQRGNVVLLCLTWGEGTEPVSLTPATVPESAVWRLRLPTKVLCVRCRGQGSVAGWHTAVHNDCV